MKVGEFSKRTGLPISTLHFYERKGLLAPSRNASGHREYDESDLAWIAFIERLKETGMPLSEIKTYADLRAQGNETLQQRMDMLIAHRKLVVESIQQWQDNLEHLDKKIGFYESELKATK